MHQSKLCITLYAKKNLSGISKSWRKNNASLFQIDKKHLGVNAAILSRCLELFTFKLLTFKLLHYLFLALDLSTANSLQNGTCAP